MARSITEISDSIKSTYVSNRADFGLPADDPASWSVTSIKRLFITVVSFSINWLEKLFDLFRTETEAQLKALKPPTREWYAAKALAFQYGFSLIAETDEFNNTGYSAAQISASKVVAYAALTSITNAFGKVELRLKLAGAAGNELTQLPDEVQTAVREYFSRVKPAGDNLTITSSPADRLRMRWRVYYNPLILDGAGNRLDGQASDVVRTAIKQFLVSGIRFSGTYSITYHIDYLQQVEGVVIPEVLECYAAFGNYPFQTVTQLYVPDGGWIRFDQETDLTIEYIPQSELQ